MMQKQAAPKLTCTHIHMYLEGKKKVIQTHIQIHTQAASLHLRNVTGLLLHSKPTGALNKHLFLPVNPLAFTMLLTRLSQGTQTPSRVCAVLHCFLTSHALLLSMAIPPTHPKAIYTLTFGIQIKKRGQGEAERITVAYESDSCLMRLVTGCTHIIQKCDNLKFSCCQKWLSRFCCLWCCWLLLELSE